MNSSKDENVKIAILAAAKIVFQKWGLKKTTMEDIAQEVGKAKSTLYYYYKSKDEIFESLLSSELDTIILKATASIKDIQSSKEKLKKYISMTLVEIKNTVSLFPLVKGEIKGDKSFIEKLSKKVDEKEELIIMNILSEGFKKGELDFLNHGQLSKASNAIVGIIRGLELYLFLDNDDNEKIDIITKIITEGI